MNKIILLTLFSLVACGKFNNPLNFKLKSSSKSFPAALSAAKIKVEVFYEPGAEPYTLDNLNPLPVSYWEILQKNLEALFAGKLSADQISVPKDLAAMKKITLQNKTTWTAEEVLTLADSLTASVTGNFRILFVNGYSKEGPGIIGFQITGTNVIVIFKDVIKSTGTTNPLVTRYVEQATLVHEIGHGLGLVNNGLPMASDHHDSAHGAHCSVKTCVMYYENEGLASMLNFAELASKNLSVVMYDQQCLNDAKSYAP